jgi:gamma-glutamyltranspeptidase / glutathione hydrolase / leukotriene-C4 hydrolase
MVVRVPPSAPGEESEVWTVDFRETAPVFANATMYADDPIKSKFGGLAIAVPGEVRGLAEAHKRWGKLPWKRLVQPSADLAQGWTVGRELGRRLYVGVCHQRNCLFNLIFSSQWPIFDGLFLRNPDLARIFAPQGVLLKEGDIIQNLNLSRTLGLIADRGPDAFYQGEIADAIIAKIRAEGGIMTHDDLTNYEVKVYRALQGTYRGRKVYTPHAPTSGPVLLHMLNLMEKYDLPVEGQTGVNVHRLVEAMKCESSPFLPSLEKHDQ